MGDKEKACSFFAKAMEIDPLSTDPKYMLDEID
jgi:hypothetical protein